jgi:hypothetical protein
MGRLLREGEGEAIGRAVVVAAPILKHDKFLVCKMNNIML